MNARYSKAELVEMDKSFHLHPFTDLGSYAKTGGRVVTEAEHIYIKDADGNQILDGMSGLWCTNLGYSQKKIVEAITNQLNTLPFLQQLFQLQQ